MHRLLNTSTNLFFDNISIGCRIGNDLPKFDLDEHGMFKDSDVFNPFYNNIQNVKFTGLKPEQIDSNISGSYKNASARFVECIVLAEDPKIICNRVDLPEMSHISNFYKVDNHAQYAYFKDNMYIKIKYSEGEGYQNPFDVTHVSLKSRKVIRIVWKHINKDDGRCSYTYVRSMKSPRRKKVWRYKRCCNSTIFNKYVCHVHNKINKTFYMRFINLIYKNPSYIMSPRAQKGLLACSERLI